MLLSLACVVIFLHCAWVLLRLSLVRNEKQFLLFGEISFSVPSHLPPNPRILGTHVPYA